jgi:hypothetical protein
MKAKSIKGNSVEEIKTALELSMGDARPPARLSHSGGEAFSCLPHVVSGC